MPCRLVGDAGRSGQGDFDADRGRETFVRAHRDASRTAPGRLGKAYLFHHMGRLRQKRNRRGNGTRGAPQLRQPPPRRRPAVHVQHEVDDRDVMTDLDRRPHRSTRFPRPRPMEKNNGLTQHQRRNSVPRAQIGDPGGAPSEVAVPNGTVRLVGESRMKLQSEESAQKHCQSVPAFQPQKRWFVFGRFIKSHRPTGTAGRFWVTFISRGG